MLTERQTEAIAKLRKGSGIVWWKIGEGKTRIALMWSKYHTGIFNPDGTLAGQEGECLVICSPTAFRQWEDENNELGIYAQELKFLSYGAITGKYWEWTQERILKDVKCIIVDELWLYKNPRSNRTKALNALTTRFPSLGLSGSIVTARNIEDLYGQAYAMGLSHKIARSLTAFRSEFCVSFAAFGGIQFTARKNALPIVQERIAANVDIYFPADVREKKFIRETVDLTTHQQHLINELTEIYYVKEGDHEIELKNAANLISKIQQISDGAVTTTTKGLLLVQSTKLERTLALCKELFDAGERVIIWTAFKASLDLLFFKLGKKATTLSSHTKFDFKGFANGQYKACICTVGSGASLNDFKDVKYSICYSLPFNYRAVQQALGRTNRKTSGHSCAYYYLMESEGSVDREVNSSLKITGAIEETMIATSEQVIGNWNKSRLNRK